MRILLWHVHGSWTTSFVHGTHTYLVPALPDRGPYGRGRAQTWDWPDSVVEVTPADAATSDVDLVLLQRPEEFELATAWLGGRRPGRDVAAVYVEHNAPQGRIEAMRHPAADRDDLVVVHVTHFNHLMWDVGSTPATVVEHGIIDPGYRFTGELDRAAAMANEPVRRNRVTGTDLLPRFGDLIPVDLYGLGTEGVDAGDTVVGHGNLVHRDLHDVIARRRVYVHPYRWTSLGLALLEAMHVGLPIVALDTTETAEAVPPDAGVVSNRWDVIADAVRRWRKDPDEARAAGLAARRAALSRYGVDRFLADMDDVLHDAVARRRGRR